jgi:hypothetical protein
MNGSLGRLKNLKLLGSCQFIFLPEISGFATSDIEKAEEFHVNSDDIQKQNNFLSGGIRKHFPSLRCERRHKGIARPPKQTVAL